MSLPKPILCEINELFSKAYIAADSCDAMHREIREAKKHRDRLKIDLLDLPSMISDYRIKVQIDCWNIKIKGLEMIKSDLEAESRKYEIEMGTLAEKVKNEGQSQ